MHNRLALARVFARFLARLDACDETRDYILLFLREATDLTPIAGNVRGVSAEDEARLLKVAFDETHRPYKSGLQGRNRIE